jgi:N-acetylglucosaminyldiphosphoundecaprenol N-acetyl-beta-D-mannosaminyltransferase
LITNRDRDALSVFLLGDTTQTLDALCKRAVREGWERNLSGWYSPSRAEVDSRLASLEIVQRVNASGADILLVGFGIPRQEKWMAMWRDHLRPGVGIGVGGALKFVAWPSRRAPKWMQRAGLEWAHRLALEPSRLGPRYLRNLLVLPKLATSVYRGRLTKRHNLRS